MATKLTPSDVQGKPFKVGSIVARAAKYFQVDGLHVKLCTVTRIDGHKVYLDNSPRPMMYPERLALVKGSK